MPHHHSLHPHMHRQSRLGRITLLALVMGAALAPTSLAAETESETVIQGLDPMTKLMRRFRAGPAVDPVAWANAPTITWPGLALLAIDPAEVKDNSIGFVVPARNGEVIDLTTKGQWADLPDGSRVCRVKVHAPDARGTRLKMFDLDLPTGATLTLGDARNGEVFGQYENRGLLLDGEFWTATVPGETVLVEIAIPAAEADEPVVAELSDLLHQFVDLFAPDSSDASIPPDGYELPCHEDVACYLAADDPMRAAVVKLSYIEGTGGFICSGSILADGDPETQIPWLLTADHCLNTQESAETLEAIFFHELEECDLPRRRQRIVTEGAGLVAATSQTDITLMRLVEPVPIGGALVGLKSDLIQGGGITMAHHPRGSRKRYAQGRIESVRFCRTASDYINVNMRGGMGFSEGGSSGSPLYNSDGKVIGQLYGVCLTGPSRDCTGTPQLPHIYGRLSSSFSKLDLDLLLTQPNPDDGFEPNNSFGQAVKIKDGLYNMLLRDADDYLFFDVIIGGNTSIAVTYNASNMDIGLTLLSPTGQQLAAADNAGSPLVIQQDLEQGRYWIRITRNSRSGPYDLFIDFNRVPGDVTGDDNITIDDLIVVLRTFGTSCTAGINGCGEVTGDGFVDFSDVRVLLEKLGYSRENFDGKTWKKQAKILSKQMKDQLKQIKDRDDRKDVTTRLKGVPTEKVDLILRILARYGRACSNTGNCADITGDGRVTSDDLRIALADAGFDRDAYDTKQWTKVVTRLFKREMRKLLPNYSLRSESRALSRLTDLDISPPPPTE